jgi:hypothetical protein
VFRMCIAYDQKNFDPNIILRIFKQSLLLPVDIRLTIRFDARVVVAVVGLRVSPDNWLQKVT